MANVLRIGIVGFGLYAIGQFSELNSHSLLKGKSKLIVGYDPNPNANRRFEKIERRQSIC